MKTPDALPSERLDSATKAVRETLVLAKHPRLITALAPAIVRNIDAINLHQVNVELAQVGPQRRGSVYRETKRAVHSPDYLIGDDALVQHIRAMTSK